MNYTEHDATSLAELVRQNAVTPTELLDAALAQVEAVNPALNAVVLMQEQAARRLISQGLPAGALSGVPFLLKDLGAAAIDFPSHNGSRLLRNTTYHHNSTLYNRLAAAGLVTFGRTTAPESGIGATTEAVVYGGPTRNPWDLSRSSGGSSGGAAAAIASGIVPAAHGSDGGGSIRIPASCCGLFGFKASRGRLPKGPNAGEGWGGMAIDGFLSRSVRDSALLLDLTEGYEAGAPYCAPPLADSYVNALKVDTGPLRIALCETTFTGEAIHPECVLAVHETARLLEDMGHHIEIARPKADHMGMTRAWMRIVACGVALDMREALAALNTEMTPENVEGVTRGAVEYAKDITGEQYLEALGKMHHYSREMAVFFDQYDMLLTATLAEPPAMLGRLAHDTTDFEHYRLGPEMMMSYAPFTAVFNVTGQPAASLPLHQTADGLPVGVHLAARFGADETLMTLCRRIEEAKPWFARTPDISDYAQ